MGRLMRTFKASERMVCTVSAERLQQLAAEGEPLVVTIHVEETHSSNVMLAFDAPGEVEFDRVELLREGNHVKNAS